MARKLAFDRLLFGSVVLLVFLGLLMIYSASAMQIYLPTSAAPAGAYFFVIKQTIAVVIGSALAFLAMSIDYRRLNDPRLIGASLVLLAGALAAVLFRAPVNGARRSRRSDSSSRSRRCFRGGSGRSRIRRGPCSRFSDSSPFSRGSSSSSPTSAPPSRIS